MQLNSSHDIDFEGCKIPVIFTLGVRCRNHQSLETSQLNSLAGILEAIAHAPVKKRAITNHDALNEAYAYARPSSFSRGMRIDLNGIVILLISGTASINEHGQTIHIGDFPAQLRRTFDNITGCWPARGRRGMTWCEPVAISRISIATTTRSMQGAQPSSRNRDSIHFPRQPAFRPDFAGPSCWWRSKRSPCTARIKLRPAAKSRRSAHYRASGAAVTMRFAFVTAITLLIHSQCYK